MGQASNNHNGVYKCLWAVTSILVVFKLEQQQRPAENQERGLDLQHFISSCKNNVSLLPYTLVYLISMKFDYNICEAKTKLHKLY